MDMGVTSGITAEEPVQLKRMLRNVKWNVEKGYRFITSQDSWEDVAETRFSGVHFSGR